MASLSKLRTETSGYVVRWQDLKLPAALSPEEAHFWLEAMTNPPDCNVTPKALAEKLAKKKYTGDIDVAAAIELLKRKVLRDPDEIATALVTLLSVDGYLDLVFFDAFRQGHESSLCAGVRAACVSVLDG